MESSSTTPNSEPTPGAEASPFHEGTMPRDATAAAPSLRAVGHSLRVADIIMLTVVVAVLFAIAVDHASDDAPQIHDSQGLMVGLIVAGSLAGLGVTLFVQRNIIAALFGGAVGAAMGAALPSLLWDADTTPAVMIGGGVLLTVGAVLGALRRHGEAASKR
jgi:preprotein translocase subunit SecY